MASYTNLASLASLQVGDVVTYNAATTIDFKKYKVRIQLNGVTVGTIKGGLTQLDLETKNLPSQTFTYTPLYGTSLCYGSNADLYYRIAVAGNSGGSGAGGGTTGGNGSSTTDYGTAYGGNGGTQTGGGSGGSWSKNGYGVSVVSGGGNGTSGSFGTNSGAGVYKDYTCAGWYAGGTGGYFTKGSVVGGGSKQGGSGGGSGFIIGSSTTTYPNNYLGNDTTLQSTIASAISNATLTQGASGATSTYTPTSSSAYMTLEVLEVPNNFPKYYNGSAWVDTEWKRWNGSAWEDIEVKYYNGTSWV